MSLCSRRRSSSVVKRSSLVEHYPLETDSSLGADWSSSCSLDVACYCGGDRIAEGMTSPREANQYVPTSSAALLVRPLAVAAIPTGHGLPIPRIPQVQPAPLRILHQQLHNAAATAPPTTASPSAPYSSCCHKNWSAAASCPKRRKSLEYEPSHSMVAEDESTLAAAQVKTPPSTALVTERDNNEKAPSGIIIPAKGEELATIAAPALSETSASSTRSSASSHGDENEARAGEAAASRDLSGPPPPPPATVLAQLARQLEYYFSERNLSKDTYLQTLRKLNDGCVPATILADFGKVRAILVAGGVSSAHPDDRDTRLHAVLQAVAEHSDLLRVRSVETSTGKIVTDDTPSAAPTILAVGPANHRPLALPDQTVTSSAGSSSSSFSGTTTSNTIILREVQPDVTEDEIRELFCFDDCPAIESVRPDVAYCWFVTLLTESRDDMLRVMMRLRSTTLRSEYVQARLKATVAPPPDSAPPPAAYFPSQPISAWAATPFGGGMPEWNLSWIPQGLGATVPKKRNKKKKNSKKNKKKSASTSDSPESFASASSPATVGKAAPSKGTAPTAPPPSLGEDNFPTLQLKKVEFDTDAMPQEESSKPATEDYDDGEELRRCSSVKSISDAASTATTNSSSCLDFPYSSSSSAAGAKPKPALGGYAAALLRAAAPVQDAPTPRTAPAVKRLSSSSTVATSSSGASSSTTASEAAVATSPPPSTWGRGPSFAEVVRRAELPAVLSMTEPGSHQ